MDGRNAAKSRASLFRDFTLEVNEQIENPERGRTSLHTSSNSSSSFHFIPINCYPRVSSIMFSFLLSGQQQEGNGGIPCFLRITPRKRGRNLRSTTQSSTWCSSSHDHEHTHDSLSQSPSSQNSAASSSISSSTTSGSSRRRMRRGLHDPAPQPSFRDIYNSTRFEREQSIARGLGVLSLMEQHTKSCLAEECRRQNQKTLVVDHVNVPLPSQWAFDDRLSEH